MSKPRLQCRIERNGEGYRVLLGDVDITEYIAEFNIEVESNRANMLMMRNTSIYTTGEDLAVRRGPQRTTVKLELVNLEIIHAGATDDSPRSFSLGTAKRKLDLG